jgi:hypothetical protein
MRGRSPFGEAGNFVSAHQMSVEARLANRSLLDEAAATSDPSLRGVFDEDAVSVAGDVFALIGMGLNKAIGSSIPRAIAAVLIALVLVRISLRLVSAITISFSANRSQHPTGTESERFSWITPASQPFASFLLPISAQTKSGF